MKQYFDNYKEDFLSASEDNFSTLLKKSSFLHEQIVGHVKEGVPRIPLRGRFNYDDIVHDIPLKGESSEKVLEHLATAFQGGIRWHQSNALVNIIPNPLLDSVAAATMTTLYNSNSFWDYMSGNMTRFEKEVVAFLSHIAGWDSKRTEGLSTSGGKATLMYAIRCGLNVCDRDSVSRGLQGEYVVIAGKTAHYSLEDCCNYLGMGRDSVVRVAVNERGAMIPRAFKKAMRESLQKGKKVAAIIALGGDTLEHTIDPVKQIDDIRRALRHEYRLEYLPFLHLDSVNAWVALVFREYDFDKNPLAIEPRPLKKIKILSRKMNAVTYADSFSADLHKTGLAPYISSFFVVKNGSHLHSINKTELLADQPSYYYGELHTHHISFENSRPSAGIVSAWTSLHRLGIEGFQRYWTQLIVTGIYIRDTIQQNFREEMEVLNIDALGHPNVIRLIPHGDRFSYEQLLSDNSAREIYSAYCFELYDYMAYHLLESNTPYPLLGFVPSYKYEVTGVKCPAFLIYLNDPHLTAQDCNALLQSIVQLKKNFETYRKKTAHSAVNRLSHLPK